MVDFKKKLEESRAQEALQKKLDKLKRQSAPSMNTWTGPVKEKKEKDPPPPDLREIDIPDHTKTQLGRLITRYASISATQRTLNKQKKDIVEDGIKPLCKLYKLDKFMVGETRSAYYKVIRRQISNVKLLAAGVAPEVILACTEVKEIWQFKTWQGDTNGDEDNEE